MDKETNENQTYITTNNNEKGFWFLIFMMINGIPIFLDISERTD